MDSFLDLVSDEVWIYHGMLICMIPKEQIEKYTTMMYRLTDGETWDDKVVGLNTRTSSSIGV